MQWGQRLTLPGSGAGACARGRVSALPCLVEGADGSRATFPSEFLKEMLVKQTTFLQLDLAGGEQNGALKGLQRAEDALKREASGIWCLPKYFAQTWLINYF